jgi:hypothetical protein
MSPLMMRLFTLVGIALAATSMQSRARAETPADPPVQVHGVTWHTT